MTTSVESSAPAVPDDIAPGVVDLRNVSRWYGNVVAVNDITMALGTGVTGLLGPNGAGKTTILHMMAGFLAPSRGSVTIEGKPTWRNPAVYRDLGLVTEREAVHAFLTAEQFVLACARMQKLHDPAGATRRALELVEMTDAANRRIGTFSKGMRQRTRVAAALVHEPRVLLLDEPFNGMDPRQRMHMMELLHRLGDNGHTILFSSHILEEVEQVAGLVQVIVAGRLAASGDYRKIRRLMTNRPHVFAVRSSDDRRLAVALIGEKSVAGIEIENGGMTVRASDYGDFTRALPRIALDQGIRLHQLVPSDESLESVFSYLLEA
ncbi:ABC-2 type transport system ATP-binding protein [Actinoplanes octamycinicus]|uniref:ABC-2 type transport system ATP-binding protein n=1 Tax=Actinoplanes octamycinicus TaxID=135948 RepID=A0A7W7GVH7_9ACTN|nr:ABC-2 type transport system ATP-binding protein [Actinoplanes octamycinicus]GIE60095.1 ABC transporter ATP-binding protein [Actinoplanes octamycinicus]